MQSVEIPNSSVGESYGFDARVIGNGELQSTPNATVEHLVTRLSGLTMSFPDHVESQDIEQAQQLWSALAMNLGSGSPSTSGGMSNAALSRIIGCLQRVLQSPKGWQAEPTTTRKAPIPPILTSLARVTAAVCQLGAKERAAIVHEGILDLVLQTTEATSGSDSDGINAEFIQLVLSVLELISKDEQLRQAFLDIKLLRFVLALLRQYARDVTVQRTGCSVLHLLTHERVVLTAFVHEQGLVVLVDEMRHFVMDVPLATKVIQLFAEMSRDLALWTGPNGATFVAAVEAIIITAIKILQKHYDNSSLQTQGIAVLAALAQAHSVARMQLVSNNVDSISLLVDAALEASRDTTHQVVRLLEAVLSDARCLNTIAQSVEALTGKHQWMTLQGHLQCSFDSVIKPDARFVLDRIERLLNSDPVTPPMLPSSEKITLDRFGFSDDEDDAARYLDQDSPAKLPALPDSFRIDSNNTTLHTTTPPMQLDRPKPNPTSVDFDKPNARYSTEAILPSTSPPCCARWQHRCNDLKRKYINLQDEHRLLRENYRMVLRRAQEQSQLLNIQNSRLTRHLELHQQVLARVVALERDLEDAERRHQVERELRLAEVAQSEQVTLSLSQAMQEIQTLNTYNMTASRDLQQAERLRADSQSRVSIARQQQQLLELERDDARLQISAMENSTRDLTEQLEQARDESNEILQMREEDADAPKPTIFRELLRGPLVMLPRRGSHYRLTTKRVNSYSGTVLTSACVQPVTSAMQMTMADVKGGNEVSQTDGRMSVEIEHALETAYNALEGASEGTGVHLAIVRKFFMDSGIVQPPLISGDIDAILAKVLNQAQENRKRVVARKDFASPTLTTGSFLTRTAETSTFRFFDQEAFFAAVTTICMRRFPRCDARTALHVFLTEYVHIQPLRDQVPQRHRNASIRTSVTATTLDTPGACVHGFGTTGCGTIMKAMLEQLILSIGQDVEESSVHNHEDTRTKPDASSGKRHREHVLFSMLEMDTVLEREQKPVIAICEFYQGLHPTTTDLMSLSFELVLNFAMDFEIIPSFMDRVTLKRLYAEVGGFVKTYFASQKKFPHATDPATLKRVSFNVTLARLALELFSNKHEYETPEKQITALLQWIDNSMGREKLMRKAIVPIVIKFSRRLYAPKTSVDSRASSSSRSV